MRAKFVVAIKAIAMYVFSFNVYLFAVFYFGTNLIIQVAYFVAAVSMDKISIIPFK